MANLYTKLGVSICTHYKDMKSNANYRHWGGLWRSRLLAMSQFSRVHMSFYSILYKLCICLVPFLRSSESFVEIRPFLTAPPAFGVP